MAKFTDIQHLQGRLNKARSAVIAEERFQPPDSPHMTQLRRAAHEAWMALESAKHQLS